MVIFSLKIHELPICRPRCRGYYSLDFLPRHHMNRKLLRANAVKRRKQPTSTCMHAGFGVENYFSRNTFVSSAAIRNVWDELYRILIRDEDRWGFSLTPSLFLSSYCFDPFFYIYTRIYSQRCYVSLFDFSRFHLINVSLSVAGT